MSAAPEPAGSDIEDHRHGPGVLDDSVAPPPVELGTGGGQGAGPGGQGTKPTGDGSGGRGPLSKAATEWIVLIVAAVVIALVIKSFLFQAFYIPSESMVPTLKVGDRVLVNKLSYRLHDVHRGDVVVFESEPNRQWRRAGIKDLVKRVVGLPGETVTQCEGRNVCIDGRRLHEDYLPPGVETAITSTPPGCMDDSPADGCHVPPGHYFVMGDNRIASSDARAHGPITKGSIVGRVFVRMWPVTRLDFL